MGITPEYTKSAINKYNEKFDRKAVNLPKGTAERIKNLTGKSCNAYIVDLVLTDLERLERKANKYPQNAENAPDLARTSRSDTKNNEDKELSYMEMIEAEERAKMGEAEYQRRVKAFEEKKRAIAAQMGLDYDAIISGKHPSKAESNDQRARKEQEPPF